MDDRLVQPVNDYSLITLTFRLSPFPQGFFAGLDPLGYARRVMADTPSSAPPASPIQRLLTIMSRLRDPAGGCPWDLAQTFRSIAPYTIEEAYEVADAIERGDMEDLKEELGDLLLQVVFHARIAEEDGMFDFAGVAEEIADKMIRRHPHVFADTTIANAAAQSQSWETHKAAERAAKLRNTDGPTSVLDDVTVALPALSRALTLQRRAARVGFDWPTLEPVVAKIEEELGEVRHEITAGGTPERLEDELGDLFFAVANLARHLDVDAETALRRANTKFERRFRQVEHDLVAQGHDLNDVSLDEMETAWQAVKASED